MCRVLPEHGFPGRKRFLVAALGNVDEDAFESLAGREVFAAMCTVIRLYTFHRDLVHGRQIQSENDLAIIPQACKRDLYSTRTPASATGDGTCPGTSDGIATSSGSTGSIRALRQLPQR